MLVVIPTGGANISSVTNSLDRLDLEYNLSESVDDIKNASKVILPGVGAAESAMKRLRDKGLVECIRNLTVPTLGICLGMQLLFEYSNECSTNTASTECLGIIPGTVTKISPPINSPLPHMGWNSITARNGGSELLNEIDGDAYFYFVHSFMAPKGDFVKASTEYGGEVPALVQNKNFYGAQFHPERSAKDGAQLLKNFVGIK
jgi:imidazole glycerol-phosphate synthase subunit HisH